MDPCSQHLTDTQYLQHMIPHHQVALDMSRALLETSTWPELLGMARNIIWVQDMEIKLMQAILHRQMDRVSSTAPAEHIYVLTQGDLTAPNTRGISNTVCDPAFFGHGGHGGQGHLQAVTDDSYIQHMIPHHQVAVDMSKRLLQVTNNDYMIDLAYTIIRSQQSEIAKLAALSHATSSMRFQSELLS